MNLDRFDLGDLKADPAYGKGWPNAMGIPLSEVSQIDLNSGRAA